MNIERLVIASPSGNITAIVFDPTPRERMRDGGAQIQSTYPDVEQVLFVEQKSGTVHGQMAGGEFCGNAARALGYLLANRQDSRQSFTMSSGGAEPLPVTVDMTKDHATLTAVMALAKEKIVFEEVPVPIVHLQGISHGVMWPDHPMYNFLKRTAARPDRWRTVTHVLEDLGIIDKPASGLIFAERDGRGIGITPYVFVKSIDTLYPEMACASGSVAAAFAMSGNVAPANCRLSIRQPSNENLEISIKPLNGRTEIKVAGSMSVKWAGPAADLHYSAAALSGRHGTAATGRPSRQARAAL
jgi:diaminopimelate epimerase